MSSISATDQALMEFIRILERRVDWLSHGDVSGPDEARSLLDEAHTKSIKQTSTRSIILGSLRNSETAAWDEVYSTESTYSDVANTVGHLVSQLDDPSVSQDDRRKFARMLHGVAPHIHSSAIVSKLPVYLSIRVVRPWILSTIERAKGGVEDEVIVGLGESNEEWARLSALIYITTLDPSYPELAPLVFDTLDQDNNSNVRERAARWLWSLPRELDNMLPELIELTSDSNAIVRSSALTGASRLIWKDRQQVEPREVAKDVVPVITESLADPQASVRRRAVIQVREAKLLSDEVWEDVLSFDERWELAMALSDALGDEDQLVVERSRDFAFDSVKDALCGDHEGLAELVRHGWEAACPTSSAAKEGVANFAADDPSAFAEFVEYPLESVASGTAGAEDIRILAEMAHYTPSRIRKVIPGLISALDEDGEYRRQAARALAILERNDFEIEGIEHNDLISATEDVVDTRFHQERLEILADVDTNASASILSEAYANSEEGDNSYGLTRAVQTMAESHPEVVIDSAGTIIENMAKFGSGSVPRIADGIATVAESNPDALSSQAEKLAPHVAMIPERGRQHVGHALISIGTADEHALPDAVITLLDQPPDLTDPAWPFGYVASNDPDYAKKILFKDLWRIDRIHAQTGGATTLLDEAALGRREVAVYGVERLAERIEDTSSCTQILRDLSEDRPEVVAEVTDDLVKGLKRFELPRGPTIDLEYTLQNISSVDPISVRSAIRSVFGSSTEFIEHEMCQKKHLRQSTVN
jgi:hypothetical protein